VPSARRALAGRAVERLCSGDSDGTAVTKS